MVRKFAIGAFALSLAACSAEGDPAPDTADEAAAPTAEDQLLAQAESEAEIQHFLLGRFPEVDTFDYALAWTDLDGDGADEAVVHVISPMLCGSGGCNTLVLTQEGTSWRLVGDLSVSRTPVTVMESTTNGWHDLTVAVSGGGMEGGNALLKFDGEAYPANPTVPPAEPTSETGTVLLGEEPTLITLEAAMPVGD